jgi:cardiolipin synthase A/B
VSVWLRGPIVHSVQSCFGENWGAVTGEILLGDRIYPTLDPVGQTGMHAAFVKPHGWAPAVKAVHHAAICMAQERIWIQNPYFLPKPEAIAAMGRAVQRGVDVRVLTPATEASDNPMVQHASHRNFENLLRRGVRIFEYPHTLLHQKVMTVDRKWCSIGSSNFDDRSFDTNDEVVIGIQDEKIAARLDEIFTRYAGRAREIDRREWAKRTPRQRLRSQLWYLLNEVL